MRVDVPMPVVTEAGEDGVVTAWLVDEGGRCSEGQLLAEVQAEKVASEVHAPAEGFVVDRVAINDPIPQGAPICAVVDKVTADSPPPPPAPEGTRAARTPLRASPAAKRVARELGVDLGDVGGSGPEGRITEDDVRSAAEATDSGSRPTALRQTIARNLRRSHAETVPVTLFTTVDLGALRPDRLTARVVKAAAAALVEHPGLNGRRVGDVFEASDHVHVSLAVQTDQGLVAPVIRDANTRSTGEIADAIADLASRARAKQLSAGDYEDGTFSVTNLGGYGIEGFTPVINLPEIAILGVGQARKVPALADDGAVRATYEMVLSLTFDHAFIDGAPAAEFLAAISKRLTGY